MKTDKQTFVFRLEWAQVLKQQPDSIRLAVYDAIIDYVQTGNEPPQDSAVYFAFLFIKNQIDKDAVKYEEVCAKRAAAGKKHKGNQHTNNRNKLEQAEQMEQMFQNGTNGTDNDNEYDNDIDNNTTINSSDIVCAEKSAPQPKPTIEQRENDFMFKVAEIGKGVYPDNMLRKFFDYWTEKNENGKKMRFEKEKVFDIKKRLATWASRDKEYKFNSKGNGDARNNPSDANYVSSERIVAAGRAWANVINQ
jgi:hypothetical protein